MPATPRTPKKTAIDCTASGVGKVVEQALAGCHPPDILDGVAASDLLEDIAGSAGHDRGEKRYVVREAGEHQTRDFGIRRADLPARLDVVHTSGRTTMVPERRRLPSAIEPIARFVGLTSVQFKFP
jgi:hypothetical protein